MGPQPHPGGFLPVQRKLGLPCRRRLSRGLGGHVVVLVDCSGCRSRREASGPSVHAPGSSHPASCSDGEVTSEAGPRRQSREHGDSSRRSRNPGPHGSGDRGESLGRSVSGVRRKPRARDEPERGREPSSREGVLVSQKRSSLTRRPWKRAWRFRRAGPSERSELVERSGDRGRQRPCHRLGTRTRTPLSGGTARRSFRSRLHQDRVVLQSRGCSGSRPQVRSYWLWLR